MLGASGPLTGACTQTLQVGCLLPFHMVIFPSPLNHGYTHIHPHLSQKVCRQGRTLGQRYRSRQILHTRNCLSIGCTSGPGLSSLFAMVTTDGSCHSHQPVYREMVSSKGQHFLSPYKSHHLNSIQRNVPIFLAGEDMARIGRSGVQWGATRTQRMVLSFKTQTWGLA